MPSQQELGDVLLQFVEHGTYPESEDAITAELPADAVPSLLDSIAKQREEAKNEIRALSRDTAPDIDGWIAQAKQLQKDIERSRATAQDIVRQAESGRALQAHVEDASAKVGLLEAELSFNETLAGTLEHVQSISGLLDRAQDAVAKDQATQGLDKLEEVNRAMVHLDGFVNNRFAGLLQDRASRLRAAIIADTTECWNALVQVDSLKRRIVIKTEVQRASIVNMNTVIEAMSKLQTFDDTVDRFSQDVDHIILSPCSSVQIDHGIAEFSIEGDSIQVTGCKTNATVSAFLENSRRVAEYFSTRLPPMVTTLLSQKLMPSLISRLTADWLVPSVPVSLDGIQEFQDVLAQVLSMADQIGGLGWVGQDELVRWVESAPRIWLSKRKESALAETRNACYRGTPDKKSVERVETQVVSHDDVIMGGDQAKDDWEAGWSDDETKGAKEVPGDRVADDDVDASAWGLEEDETQSDNKVDISDAKNSTPAGEDDAEAWGWGDEETGTQDAATPAAQQTQEPRPAVNGSKKSFKPSERELTLKETYTVTAVPDAILDLIVRIVSDAEALAQPPLSESPVAPASGGLYSIPTLILAMYRGTATAYYAKDVAGNMLIYNDCNRLADQLRSFVQNQAEKDATSVLPSSNRPSTRLRLDADIKALESFAKRAYGKEMESQRTILRDLLDGAQGFTNCTVPPFAAECENAVAMTVDRIREVNRQWKDVLSRSALLQSLGSLLSTVTSKMIVEIEDMSDISEEESKRLRHFCDIVAKLSDLFTHETPDGRSSDMTGVYTPNWFKFQYLSEILESSLADIKYLWTEGELKLEFDAEELIDLIEALFAESEHRRRAIGEIRRTSMHR